MYSCIVMAGWPTNLTIYFSSAGLGTVYVAYKYSVSIVLLCSHRYLLYMYMYKRVGENEHRTIHDHSEIFHKRMMLDQMIIPVTS